MINTPNRNKKTKKHKWYDDERRIIARMAGKYPLSEITAEVNRISKIKRTELAVESEGNKLGYSFRLVA